MDKNNLTPPKLPENLVGVSGWLLLFCISLTILSPLVNIIPLVNEISSDPDLLSSIIGAILTAGPLIYGIIIGIRLWLVKPNALKHAKIFLVVVLAINLLILAVSILMRSDSRQLFSTAIRSILPFIIWWSYLSRSIRVRNTYQTTKNMTKEEKPIDTQ